MRFCLRLFTSLSSSVGHSHFSSPRTHTQQTCNDTFPLISHSLSLYIYTPPSVHSSTCPNLFAGEFSPSTPNKIIPMLPLSLSLCLTAAMTGYSWCSSFDRRRSSACDWSSTWIGSSLLFWKRTHPSWKSKAWTLEPRLFIPADRLGCPATVPGPVRVPVLGGGGSCPALLHTYIKCVYKEGRRILQTSQRYFAASVSLWTWTKVIVCPCALLWVWRWCVLIDIISRMWTPVILYWACFKRENCYILFWPMKYF